MGNNHAKKQKKPQFSKNELDVLENSFHYVAGPKEQITEPTLVQSWSSKIDKHLVKYMTNFMYKPDEAIKRPIDPAMKGARLISINFAHYTQPFYFMDRGSMLEKANFIMDSLDNVSKEIVQYSQVEMYIEAVIRSYVQIMRTSDKDPYKTWMDLGYDANEEDLQSFLLNLMSNLDQKNDGLKLVDIEKWLENNVIVQRILREVFYYLYGFGSHQSSSSHSSSSLPTTSQHINSDEELSSFSNSLIPKLTNFPRLDKSTHFKPILNIMQIIYLNSIIPNELSREWRFLFSSTILGESFSTMLGKIIDKGPTLIIVEDEDSHIFGGYAPQSWTLSSNFIGNNTTMLFTLTPTINCFHATGYNDHYQYLNLHQETMPNGLGMGGQFDYWGLWLSCEYGIGHSSESCSTFKNYTQLSKSKNFRIRKLEVWGVGELEKEEFDEATNSKTSILNKNLEDRVMLELSGQKMHSDGLRDDND